MGVVYLQAISVFSRLLACVKCVKRQPFNQWKLITFCIAVNYFNFSVAF